VAGGHDVNHMYSRDLQISMQRPLMGKDDSWGPGNSNSTYNLSCRWGRRAPAFCILGACLERHVRKDIRRTLRDALAQHKAIPKNE
jgi:hypothetical protein